MCDWGCEQANCQHMRPCSVLTRTADRQFDGQTGRQLHSLAAHPLSSPVLLLRLIHVLVAGSPHITHARPAAVLACARALKFESFTTPTRSPPAAASRRELTGEGSTRVGRCSVTKSSLPSARRTCTTHQGRCEAFEA